MLTISRCVCGSPMLKVGDTFCDTCIVLYDGTSQVNFDKPVIVTSRTSEEAKEEQAVLLGDGSPTPKGVINADY